MTPAQERLTRLLAGAPPGDCSTGEWQELVAEACRHGLAPLLYYRLSRRGVAPALPATLWEKMLGRYRLAAAANLLRFHSLTPVLAGLKVAGVPVIVLKGAYLASAVYDQAALRTMSDVDLLVHREDLPRADAVLTAAGFRRREFELAAGREENEFHYLDPTGHAPLELHWDLYKPDYPFRFDLPAMWRSSLTVTVAGEPVRVFAPEDQLLHLASHAAVHRFEFGLRPLCDLAAVLARCPIDWPLLVENARRAGVARAVGLPLFLARDLLGAEVPETVVTSLLAPGLPVAMAEEARETALLNSRRGRVHGEPNPNLFLFLGRRRWRDRLTLLRNRFFPSRQTIAALYPVPADSPRVFWYYLRHGRILIARNLPGLRTLLAGRVARTRTVDRAATLMDWLMQSR